MGRREVVTGYKMLAAQSLAASFNTNQSATTGASIIVKSMDNLMLNISTTGVTANSGTFSVQHRVRKDGDTGNQSAWATLTLSAVPTLANADAVFGVQLTNVPPGEIRVGFTPGGGTPNGTVDVWVSGSSVGA